MSRRLVIVSLLLALGTTGVWLMSTGSVAPASRGARTDPAVSGATASTLRAPDSSAAVVRNDHAAHAPRRSLGPAQRRRIRVVLTRLPEHVLDRYELTAHAGGSVVAHHRVNHVNTLQDHGAPATEATFELMVVPTFRGVVQVRATHRITGWQTTIASEAVGPERKTVEIDALHCPAVRATHSLRAQVHLPTMTTEPATLRLVPTRQLDTASGTSVRLAPGRIEIGVWVHGLFAGEYVPFVEDVCSDGSVYRGELAALRIEGDTEAELRAPRDGKLFVALPRNGGGDAGAPWLEIRSRSGARVPHVQERLPNGDVEVTGLGSCEVFVQAVGTRAMSRIERLRLDEAWPQSIDLPLLSMGRLGIRVAAPGRVTGLRIAEAATSAEVLLTEAQTDEFCRMRGLQLRLPPGEYVVAATVDERVIRKSVRVGHASVLFLR